MSTNGKHPYCLPSKHLHPPHSHSGLLVSLDPVSMPQPKWLIVDSKRKIDQEAWLRDRCKRDIQQNLARFTQYQKDVANEFEREYPRTILKQVRDKNTKELRWETTIEAQARCAKRPEVRQLCIVVEQY